MSLRQLAESHVELIALNTDHFAETVCFQADSGPIDVSAIVVLDTSTPDQENEQPATFTGELHISETSYQTVSRDKHSPLTVRVRARKFNVTTVRPPEHGMVVIGIQAQDRVAGNAVGIDGKGMRYERRSNDP